MQVDDIIKDLLADLRSTGDDLYDRFTVEQRPVVERCVQRLAELTAAKITDPANETQYNADMSHNWNTLLSEATIAQAHAEKAFFDYIGRTILKLTSIALAVI